MSARNEVIEQVTRFLGTVETAASVGVVAVSGGPDSVALLRALHAVRPTGASLIVAHLNHRLRGNDSDADEAFVAALHTRLVAGSPTNLLWRCERIDVAGQAAERRVNLEAAARAARYRWLADIAREAGARWIATGHTADDQAETVLHRLLRGTGLKGLCGIPPRRALGPDVEVIRPLLRVPRAAVLAFLHTLGQDYCQDASNADLRFTRNRLRHELLPHLAERYNPAVVGVLCRLAEQVTQVQGREEAVAKTLLAEAELPRAGALLVFDAARLSAAPRHLVREMFRLVWGRQGWPSGEVGFEAWDRVAAVALGEVTAADLPGGMRVRRRAGVVQLGRGAKNDRKGHEGQA